MVGTGQQAPTSVTSNGVALAFDPAVLADEQLLQRGGFYKGTPNGYTDAAYDAAVFAARAAYGFPAGTTIEPALRAKLLLLTPETPDPVFPRQGQRIVDAQIALRDLGVYNGAASGFPNTEFDTALRNFQIRERLPSYPRSAAPILDDETLARLQTNAAAARSRGAVPTTPAPSVQTTTPPGAPSSPVPMGLPTGVPAPMMTGVPAPMMPPMATGAPPLPVAATAPQGSPPALRAIALGLGVIAGFTWGSYLLTKIR